MTVTLYPSYDSVFATDELVGIFYPLCTLTDDDGEKFHLVSSTGLFSEEDQSATLFRLEQGRYSVAAELPQFDGADDAKAIFEILDADFTLRGDEYLTAKLPSSRYIMAMQDQVSHLASEELDLDHYLSSFYSFSINKLIYSSTGKFNQFTHVIDGWGKPDESPVVHEVDESMLEEYFDEDASELGDYRPVGMAIGSEFFADGNDEIHLFDAETSTVAVIRAYS